MSDNVYNFIDPLSSVYFTSALLFYCHCYDFSLGPHNFYPGLLKCPQTSFSIPGLFLLLHDVKLKPSLQALPYKLKFLQERPSQIHYYPDGCARLHARKCQKLHF